jgi:thiol-disulfide isomerase/thioredoxin
MTRWVISLLMSLMLFAAGCSGSSSIPRDAKTTQVSLVKIDCADCGDEIVEELRTKPGVYKADFDRKRVQISVVASPSFDVFTAVRQLAANEGFEAILGAGKGAYLDWATFPEGADVRTVVTEGKDVPDLEPVLAKGKVTVIDFSAMWCKPCRLVDAHMAKVLESRADVAYRKMDVGDWDTPLAKHYLKDIPQLPYMIVYGKSGQRVGEIVGADLSRLDAAIAQGSSAR